MDNNYGSIVEPSNPYYINSPSPEPKKNTKLLIILACVLGVLVIILLVASVFMKKNEPSGEEDDEATHVELAESDVNELRISDPTTIQGVWDVISLESDGEITLASCQALINSGDSYVDKYGGTKGDESLCSSEYIMASAEAVDVFPHGDTNIIRIKDGNQCLSFSFLGGFFSLYEFSNITGECTGEMKSIKVVTNA